MKGNDRKHSVQVGLQLGFAIAFRFIRSTPGRSVAWSLVLIPDRFGFQEPEFPALLSVGMHQRKKPKQDPRNFWNAGPAGEATTEPRKSASWGRGGLRGWAWRDLQERRAWSQGFYLPPRAATESASKAVAGSGGTPSAQPMRRLKWTQGWEMVRRTGAVLHLPTNLGYTRVLALSDAWGGYRFPEIGAGTAVTPATPAWRSCDVHFESKDFCFGSVAAVYGPEVWFRCLAAH